MFVIRVGMLRRRFFFCCIVFVLCLSIFLFSTEGFFPSELIAKNVATAAKDLFKRAQESVYNLLRTDPFKRFIEAVQEAHLVEWDKFVVLAPFMMVGGFFVII